MDSNLDLVEYQWFLSALTVSSDRLLAERARDLLVLLGKGHPHPGQHYRHGWIPIDGATTEAVEHAVESATPKKPAKDRLKLAGRIHLEPGEELLGSSKADGNQGVVRIAAVGAVGHGGHRTLRLGIGGAGFGSRDDEAGPWHGGPDRTEAINVERKRLRDEQDRIGAELDRLDADPQADPERKAALQKRYNEIDDMGTEDVVAGGYTAKIDQAESNRLRAELSDALDAAVKEETRLQVGYDRLEELDKELDRMDGLPAEAWERGSLGQKYDAAEAERRALQASLDATGYVVFGEGSVSGDWADVHYRIELDDLGVGVQVSLGAVPHGSSLELADLIDNEQSANLDPAETRKLLRLLDALA